MWKKSLAMAALICSSEAMHSLAAKTVTLNAPCWRALVLAGCNNNRANHNANGWRVLA
ncbi:MAG: hypothetical protein ABI128_09140 [Rhodanobacter sp.]